MLGHLKSKLKASANFPSPPAITQQIIALARDPHVDVPQVAAAISRDPGLAAKVLRSANSALFSPHRKSTNLREALVVLGLKGATTLALGFSFVGTYKGLKSNGVDYDRYWRRSILSACAARSFGALQNASTVEDIFLAALLQDVAILGIDRTAPDFYRDLPRTATHREFVAHETTRLAADHALLGAWLLEYWKLPEQLYGTVALSHSPATADRSTPSGMAACCVALGNECGEMLLVPESPPDFASLLEHASEWLGVDALAVEEAMSAIVAAIPEIERMFDVKLLGANAASVLLDQARDALNICNLQSLGPVGRLPATNPELDAQAAAQQDAQKRDGLTGLYNRGYIDLLLRSEFRAATAGNWPLSVVFIDLDRFEGIKEAYGPEAGDSVLASTAKLIESVARDTDSVGRYGSEQFVIVLPGLASVGAKILCERLIDRLRSTQHPIHGTMVTITASVGLATHARKTPFQRASHLINAADRSVSVAKKSGRDRLVRHNSFGRASAADT